MNRDLQICLNRPSPSPYLRASAWLAHQPPDLAPLDAAQPARLEEGERLPDADHEVGLALEERPVDVGVEELVAHPLVSLGKLQQVPKRHAQLVCFSVVS